MSEENNIYENNNEETQYTQVPETNYTAGASNAEYTGGTTDYTSGKGTGQGFGIAAMICGIVSLIGCCGFWYISIPCALVAIVLGIVQIVKNQSKGMAIAGIVCGALGLIVTIVVIVASVLFVNEVYENSDVYEDMMHEIMEEHD